MGRTPGRRPVRVLAAVAVVAASLIASPSTATASSACAMNTYPIYSLDVKAKVGAKSYHIGDSAKLTVTVKRPAGHDPAGGGVEYGEPPAQSPAEGVNVGVGIRVGDVFLYGWGTPTDAEGQSHVSIKIKNYSDTGSAALDVFAWKRQLETPCVIIEEQGFLHIEDAFSIKK